MFILKQSTSIKIRMGPFVDSTNGVTPETGVTLGAADQAEVLKANGAATVTMGGAFAAVAGADGWYDYTVATGDVDAVGEVEFVVQDSDVCLPVFLRGHVVEEAVYDALFAASASALGDIKADTAAILEDTGTTLQAELDGIQADTEDIQSRIPAALVNSRMDATVDGTGMESGAVTNILTTQMTESYAANGVAPTLAQAQFAIQQMLMQFGISGTSITVRKLDDSTTAFVVTLDDDTNPTDAKRV
jgi:hypothetical protein